MPPTAQTSTGTVGTNRWSNSSRRPSRLLRFEVNRLRQRLTTTLVDTALTPSPQWE
jgi:hypothetical protein